MEGDELTYRGITITRHGRRWRFFWSPVRSYVAADSLVATIAEVDRLVNSRRRDRESTRLVGPTISELIDQWWNRKQRELRESTCMRYESVMRVHVKPRIGHLPANEIRPLDIEDYYSAVTYKTALVSRDVLRPAFRWGLANRLVIRPDGLNPLDLAKLSRSRCLGGDYDSDFNATMRVDERLIPSPGEIEKLLVDAEARGATRWWLYLRLAPTLGARPGELCALMGSDLDPATHKINISRSANKLTLKVTAVKRASSARTLHVGPQLFEEIEPIVAEIDQNEYLFPATGTRCGERKIECWTANSAYRRLRSATKRLGLPPYTPHSFRHFCATHLLDEGWPAMQVARWLGHRNDTMVRLLHGAHIVEETRTQLGEAAARLVSRSAPPYE